MKDPSQDTADVNDQPVATAAAFDVSLTNPPPLSPEEGLRSCCNRLLNEGAAMSPPAEATYRSLAAITEIGHRLNEALQQRPLLNDAQQVDEDAMTLVKQLLQIAKEGRCHASILCRERRLN